MVCSVEDCIYPPLLRLAGEHTCRSKSLQAAYVGVFLSQIKMLSTKQCVRCKPNFPRPRVCPTRNANRRRREANLPRQRKAKLPRQSKAKLTRQGKADRQGKYLSDIYIEYPCSYNKTQYTPTYGYLSTRE